MDLCIWIELLKNGLIDIMHFIISRTENNAIQEVLVILCKKAKLQAGIKPTALCSAIDKENSIESLLDLLHYIYNYCCGYASCLP